MPSCNAFWISGILASTTLKQQLLLVGSPAAIVAVAMLQNLISVLFIFIFIYCLYSTLKQLHRLSFGVRFGVLIPVRGGRSVSVDNFNVLRELLIPWF